LLTNQEEVHILEYSYPGTKNKKVINISDQSLLNQHIKDEHNFINLWLIQVAAKPNYRLGKNSPISDIRLKKINDSIIAILESNLHDGSAFFNSYPNFSMNIRNDKTSNGIKLYIQIPDEIVDELSSLIQIIYKIYYRAIKIDYTIKL